MAKLYTLDEFTDSEKVRILEIAYQVTIDGQDKKKNRNPMSRKICNVMQQMMDEAMIRVAEDRGYDGL